MPATQKQEITAERLDYLKALLAGQSTTMAIAITRRGETLPREVVVSRDHDGTLRVEASVRFGGQTAGVDWFAPREETVSRPVLIVGMYDGIPACYLAPEPREALEIGDIYGHEAEAWV